MNMNCESDRVIYRKKEFENSKDKVFNTQLSDKDKRKEDREECGLERNNSQFSFNDTSETMAAFNVNMTGNTNNAYNENCFNDLNLVSDQHLMMKHNHITLNPNQSSPNFKMQFSSRDPIHNLNLNNASINDQINQNNSITIHSAEKYPKLDAEALVSLKCSPSPKKTLVTQKQELSNSIQKISINNSLRNSISNISNNNDSKSISEKKSPVKSAEKNMTYLINKGNLKIHP